MAQHDAETEISGDRNSEGFDETAYALRARLAAIVDASDDAIISEDLDGTIRSWNEGAKRLFGYTADEVIGCNVSLLATPEVADEIPAILRRLAAGERIEHFRTKRRTKDGRILSISLSVSPVRDASRRIIGASKVARDVTELERQEVALYEANTALIKANADLEQFAYSVSHDLQEPLRMINLFGEMLRADFEQILGELGGGYLDQILSSGRRIDRMLKDIRSFILAERVDQDPSIRSEACAALRLSLANLDSLIRESSALIEYGPLPQVCAHEVQLEQLFQNLIANSIRYRSNEIPVIYVAAEAHDHFWKFSIRDNGIGIDPEYKELIFGVGKRLHNAKDCPGSGMGLAICERIVRRLGGRIWVESELGQGSTFFFTIPAFAK